MGIGETLEKTVYDEGKPATIVCNCGEKAVLTVFEVVVLIAIAVFLIYVALEKEAREKLILEIDLQRH